MTPTAKRLHDIQSYRGPASFIIDSYKGSTLLWLNHWMIERTQFQINKWGSKEFWVSQKEGNWSSNSISLPNSNKVFKVECEVSNIVIGVVFDQEGKPIIFFSKKLN